MTANHDRRLSPRLKGPFDGSWDGSSGMRTCRITDLSAGGCFVDALAAPEVGSAIIVAVELDGQRFQVPSTVAYRDQVQGFAVRFTPGEQADRIAEVVQARLAG